MSNHYCEVPGCPFPGRNRLKFTIQRPDNSAIIAANLSAWYCDDHAESGMDVDLIVQPTKNRSLDVLTTTIEGEAESQTVQDVKPINNKAQRETQVAAPITRSPNRHLRAQRKDSR